MASIAYELGGDIYTADPATGGDADRRRRPENATPCRASRATARISSSQRADGLSGCTSRSTLYVVDADEPVLRSRQSLARRPWEQYRSRQMGGLSLIASIVPGRPAACSIASRRQRHPDRSSSASGPRAFEFRPPDGARSSSVSPGRRSRVPGLRWTRSGADGRWSTSSSVNDLSARVGPRRRVDLLRQGRPERPKSEFAVHIIRRRDRRPRVSRRRGRLRRAVRLVE